MLNSLNLNDKTYEELLAEAIAQIPLYSREWTNYNVSDPGITILENLTAFQLLQQESINEVTEEIQRKLLKLVGCVSRENQAATILVQAPAQGGPSLPEGYRLWSGSIPFETTEQVTMAPWGLAAAFVESGGTARDVTALLSPSADAMIYPFGRRPAQGDSIVFVLTGSPEREKALYLWFQVAEEELRTPFTDEKELPAFSYVRWQYYTGTGWQDAQFGDETMGFLRSGCVTLWLEGAAPAPLEDLPIHGCALRCLLDTADYDRAPRLQSMALHLFPMVQKESRVRCQTFSGGEPVDLFGPEVLDGLFMVFCQEEADGPYYLYQEAGAGSIRSRCYWKEELPGGVSLRLDPGPCERVRVICYDSEMIHHRLLGPVYGYDNQTIQLDQVTDVLPDSMLLAVQVPGGPDGPAYQFVAPGEAGPGGFSYHLRSREAQLVIDEPGGGGYQLLLAGCAPTRGAQGNLRSQAVLERRGGYDGTTVEAQYLCPAPGRGGTSWESTEELRARFSREMRQTAAAVRAEDYEHLVLQTPGLCIHKVRASPIPEKNLVRISVKPYTEDRLPMLSQGYLRRLQAYLEPRRLLTTRFELCQPRYVPVGAAVTLEIRGMADHARTGAEELLRRLLDHVNGPQPFGGWLRFNEIYQALSGLPFVDAVDALAIYPEGQAAAQVGSDIRMDDDSLCYPGTIRLTLREHGR